jgi:integrase
MPKRSGEPPLYRRKDSPYWWTWIYEGARRIKVSTKCTDRTAALRKAVDLQRKGAGAKVPGAEATVEEALLAFVAEPGSRSRLTIQSYDQHAAQLSKWIGGVRVADLTAEDISYYLSSRHAAKATLRVELVVLRMALKKARARGWPVPPAEALEVPIPGTTMPKDRWLTDAEVARLCEQLLGYRADWVRVACWTGARKEEVNSLQWADVDLEAKTLRIRGTKAKRGERNPSDRLIPLSPAMADWLRARPTQTGPIVRKWINPHLTLGKACVRAGIRACTAHDFRRTFASKLKQKGVDSMVVARLLGHTTSRLVDTVYGHLDLGALRGAMELV